jgi:hypothetical protein
MREVLPNRLWLGNAGDACDAKRLLEAGIAAVISLAAEEVSPSLPRSMTSCHFPILDGAQDAESVLCVAIHTLASLLRSSVPTLVCCSGGMSRSPAVAAAAMSIAYGGSPDERLREIVSGQPHDVSPQLWGARAKGDSAGAPLVDAGLLRYNVLTCRMTTRRLQTCWNNFVGIAP